MSRAATPSDRQTAGVPGIVRRDESYTLAEFKARTGLKDWALRKLRRAGLPVRRLGENGGGPAFVLGSDWLDFLRQRSTQPNTSSDSD